MRHANRYMEVLGDATGAHRVADIVAALSPPPPQQYVDIVYGAEKKKLDIDTTTLGVQLAMAAVGGIVGYKMWRKHRVLGTLAGLAIGGHAYPLATGKSVVPEGNVRTKAATSLAIVGVSTLASLKWRKHPVAGYILGGMGAGLLSGFVPGSSMNESLHKVSQKRQ